MKAEQIEACRTSGAYVYGSTVKEWMRHQGRDGYFTLASELIEDEEMYFVNEYGVWLVE